MTPKIETSIHEAFSTLYDPRQAGKVEHPLINVIFIAVCGVLCGSNNWTQISEFGHDQEEWLKQFLDLEHGIPSHDTFGTVFGLIYCEHFSECFCCWMSLLSPVIGKHIAIDGKFARGSQDKGVGRGAIDIVSAFATESGLTLAQHKVDEKSNEITAIPQLLRLLNVRDCVVTIDAMGCQTGIATQIADAKADYILSLKGNQGKLHEDTQLMFTYFEGIDFKDVPHSYHRQINGGHGRIETREAWVFSPSDYAEYFRTLDKWPTIKTVVMVRSKRRINDKVEQETRYYISSLTDEAKVQLSYIREHWGIENSLHWVLDVAFREDMQRIRKANSAANFVTLHHIVLNLLRLGKSKGGIETKRLKCAWNATYRMQTLAPILNCESVK